MATHYDVERVARGPWDAHDESHERVVIHVRRSQLLKMIRALAYHGDIADLVTVALDCARERLDEPGRVDLNGGSTP